MSIEGGGGCWDKVVVVCRALGIVRTDLFERADLRDD